MNHTFFKKILIGHFLVVIGFLLGGYVWADAINTTDFVTTWKTDNLGSSNSSSITLPMVGGPYNVDWNNDGVYDQLGLSGSVTHDFGTAGTYTVRVSGAKGFSLNDWKSLRNDHHIVKFNLAEYVNREASPLRTSIWDRYSSFFPNKARFFIVGSDKPAVSYDGSAANYNALVYRDPISSPHLDPESYSGSFGGGMGTYDFGTGFDTHTINVNGGYAADSLGWFIFQPYPDSVVSYTGGFTAVYNYALDIDTDAKKLLFVNQWGTSTWEKLNNAFVGASNMRVVATDSPNLCAVTEMAGMFAGASSFNTNINNWDVSHVTNMQSMFQGASSFNQPLDKWDMSHVTHMSRMFQGASSFNQNIGGWNTASLVYIASMFDGATSFDQNIGGRNISKMAAIDYGEPQYRVTATNSIADCYAQLFLEQKNSGFGIAPPWDIIYQDRCGGVPWEPTPSWSFMSGVTLSTANYDALLIGRANQTPPDYSTRYYDDGNGYAGSLTYGRPRIGVRMSAGNSKYCRGEGARLSLVGSEGWTIEDGGRDPACGGVATATYHDCLGKPMSSYSEWNDFNNMISPYYYNAQYPVISELYEGGSSWFIGENPSCRSLNSGSVAAPTVPTVLSSCGAGTPTTPTPVDGVCGMDGACTVGTPFLDNGALSCGSTRTWSCLGSDGGATPPCGQANNACGVVNGACGTATNSCDPGISFDLPDSASEYLWSCRGENGGTNDDSCATTKPVAGVCGAAKNTCAIGTATNYSAGPCGGAASWSCAGSNGGAVTSCSLPNSACVSAGLCGTANGGMTVGFPSSNLCAGGSPILQQLSGIVQKGGNIDTTAFNTQFGGPNGIVYGLLAGPDDTFFAVGDFTGYNNIAKPRLAKVSVNGAVDASFNLGAVGANDTITSIAYGGVSYGPAEKLYIAGKFTTYNGVARKYIARLNSDGSLDSGFNPGVWANNPVFTVLPQEDGKVLVAGEFTSYNGTSRNRLARLNADGSLDGTFDPGVGANGAIYAMSMLAEGKILVAGDFTSYNGVGRNRLARLNADGSLDDTFDPGAGANGAIYDISVASDGGITIAGNFTSYNGVGRNRLARLNADGSLNTSFNPGSTTNNTIYAVLNYKDSWIVGGQFTTYNGISRPYIAKANSTDGLNLNFADHIGTNGTILTIKEHNNATLMIGGQFSTYNGVARNRLARVTANGTLDLSFNPGVGANDTIRGISAMVDDGFYVVGDFTSYNGVARARIAKLKTNGTVDTVFSPGVGANNIVHGVVVIPEDKLFVFGAFSEYNGQERSGIAKLNANGALDTTWTGLTVSGGVVSTLAVLSDGKLLIGGDFTSYNGTSRNRLARLNADGSLDTTFDPGVGVNGAITSLVIQEDGKILVGGEFSQYNGVSVNRLVRLTSAGLIDSTFTTGVGANNTISTLALYDHGTVFVGGSFTTYNSLPYNRLTAISVGSSLDTYTWACAGTLSTVSCQSFGASQQGNVCVPYLQNVLNDTVVFSSPDFTVGLSDEYFNMYDVNTAVITGTLGANTTLKISIANKNAYSNQLIQYREPTTTSNNSTVGGDFYGCTSQGWNVSVTGLLEALKDTVPTSAGQLLSTPDRLFVPEYGAYINPKDPDSRFLAWNRAGKGMALNCQVCTNVTAKSSKTAQTCTGLPAHAKRNTVSTISQYLENGVRYPSTQYSYNTTPSATTCNFTCELNYTWNGTICAPNTGSMACQGSLPANTQLVNTTGDFTQTWNGSSRTPMTKNYTYTFAPSGSFASSGESECLYTCKQNYRWDGSQCLPDTVSTMCPNLTVANATVVSAGPVSQTWNGSAWLPVLSWAYNPLPSTVGCFYQCNTNAVWDGNQCVPKTYARATTVSTCDYVQTCQPVVSTLASIDACNQPNACTNPANILTCMYVPSGSGTQNATSVCTDSAGVIVADASCTTAKPAATQSCTPSTPLPTYARSASNWGTCMEGPSSGGVCGGMYSNAPWRENIWIDGTPFEWSENRVYNASKQIVGYDNMRGGKEGNSGTCDASLNGQILYRANCLHPTYISYEDYSVYLNDGRYGLTEVEFNAILQDAGSVSVSSDGSKYSCEWYKAECNGSTFVQAPDHGSCRKVWCGDASSSTDLITTTEAYRSPYDAVCPYNTLCSLRYVPVANVSCAGATTDASCVAQNSECGWSPLPGATMQSRAVVCKNESGVVMPSFYCNAASSPNTTQACTIPLNGVCGFLDKAPAISNPSAGALCQDGYLVPLNLAGGSQTRQCMGSNGGTTASCASTVSSCTWNMPWDMCFPIY